MRYVKDRCNHHVKFDQRSSEVDAQCKGIAKNHDAGAILLLPKDTVNITLLEAYNRNLH